MSDPRELSDWHQMDHETRVERLLGAILDRLDDINGNTIDVEEAVKNVRSSIEY